jgi:hypothetical protein
MVKFELELETDNEEFVEDPHGAIVRVLLNVARDMSLGQKMDVCRDVNGNSVGTYTLYV